MQEEKDARYEAAKNKALRVLEYRSHSEREICDKLKRAGFEYEYIERVLEFLREYNFINDREFAEKYARDLKNIKKLGRLRVKAELMKKGIKAEFIEVAISGIDWEEEDVLTPMVRKKLGGDFERKSIDRCIRYFLYKGYSYDEIKVSIERLQSEEENGI